MASGVIKMFETIEMQSARDRLQVIKELFNTFKNLDLPKIAVKPGEFRA